MSALFLYCCCCCLLCSVPVCLDQHPIGHRCSSLNFCERDSDKGTEARRRRPSSSASKGKLRLKLSLELKLSEQLSFSALKQNCLLSSCLSASLLACLAFLAFFSNTRLWVDSRDTGRQPSCSCSASLALPLYSGCVCVSASVGWLALGRSARRDSSAHCRSPALFCLS